MAPLQLVMLGVLVESEKTTQRIFQDISLYRIPDDLEDLMRILIGILELSPLTQE